MVVTSRITLHFLTFTCKGQNDFSQALLLVKKEANEEIWVPPKSQCVGVREVAARRVRSQAAQTLFVIYIRDSIALRFKPFKRMYENGSKIALNSTCSKGFQ